MIALLAAIVAAPSAAHAAEPTASVAHETIIRTPTPNVPAGYRKATSSERRAMTRAKGLKLTRTYGWYRGRKDPKYGFVCGYQDGNATGIGVRLRNGRWETWATDSGSLQRYHAYCVGW